MLSFALSVSVCVCVCVCVCLSARAQYHVLTAEVCSASKFFSCINDSVKRIPADSNGNGDQLANLWPASLNV